MKTNHLVTAAALAAALLASGCATNDYPSPNQPAQPYSAPQARRSSYGVIDSIQVVNAGNNTSGAGVVIGGVVGGLLGNQIGAGNGRAAATAAGVIGGAVVGNQIERNKNSREEYQLNVRLENGDYRAVTQDSVADLRVGDRVRIENDRVYRY